MGVSDLVPANTSRELPALFSEVKALSLLSMLCAMY